MATHNLFKMLVIVPVLCHAEVENYDFIVVGSGSSGAVVANRLSEITSWKILLLEAGNPGNFLTSIPILAPLFQLTPYNWAYTTERQEGICKAMVDQKCSWPRGKVVGGSSIINYMIYSRGSPSDYAKWVNQGNKGWSYEEVLPYFLKSENCRLGNGLCASKYHNTSGYHYVSAPFKSKITDAFLEAGIELGEKIVDYNSADSMGFSQLQGNIKEGRRHSTADAYIYPIINTRKNFRLIISARVTKILIDQSTKRAYGVVFTSKGKNFIAKATKEVILSAGVIGSPHLLMLSGIGPEDDLLNLGIPVISNLPVGRTLYDHVTFLGLLFKINQRQTLFGLKEFLKWLVNGRGRFSSLGGFEAVAFINTESDANYPDIELLLNGVGSLEFDWGLIGAREIRLRPDFYERFYKPLEQTSVFTIIPILLHPKSRGYIKLSSNNPYDAPLLYGNYFSDPEGADLRTLLAGIRYIQKLSQTNAFQKFQPKMHDISIPGCENYDFDSDEYWRCGLRNLGVTLHHQTSTCKMGSENDCEAVVNARLKVYGVEGLRVVDSSVMPATLSGHTGAPSVMIGEKASDIIKEDWAN